VAGLGATGRLTQWEERGLLLLIGFCSVLAGWLAPANGTVALVFLIVGVAAGIRYVRRTPGASQRSTR
jgi:hypothetical protein